MYVFYPGNYRVSTKGFCMRVLWVCNQCIPLVASKLNIECGNKEGWLAGLSAKLLSKEVKDITFGICFPYEADEGKFRAETDIALAYGYSEDSAHPENYNPLLKERFREIYADFKPDVIHIFGTEYGHTLSACEACDNPEKILISMQGICDIYAKAYLNGIPGKVANRSTLRDFLKKDNPRIQKEKFEKRAVNERKAVAIAGNAAGRTSFDHDFVKEVHPEIKYHVLRETLRSNFYEPVSDLPVKERHSIFVTQGNYPIKGLHILLEALPKVAEEFPDLKVYVAGDIITGQQSLKRRILISSYGKYIKSLIKKGGLKENIFFTGNITGEEVKKYLLKSEIFCMPSMMENSPNSLGEAMLLKTPVIASRVGGVPDMIEDRKEGILYEACDAASLADELINLLRATDSDSAELKEMIECAYKRALINHDGAANFNAMLDIYGEICK